jgi:hypothetical protein
MPSSACGNDGVWGLKAKIIDVETAFLFGDLEEEIYMEIPSGI